ncbi:MULTISPECIES: DNA cytosine methyltransferase [unclassified Nonomuraea]|uniref:DNA cytosine methyltransferase n=1 Tax=unclassified Nonomuraea TaxID=2593643 RepID=UPI0033D0CF8F
MTISLPSTATPPTGNGLRVLDLYCCQGGATRGYQLAGFHVTGVDIADQPRYVGQEFHQADALTFLHTHRDQIRREFAFVHASPPCQHDSDTQRLRGNDHPDLIAPTRQALDALGLPYVIENVKGALPKLRTPVMLCGAMFGLATYRHRYFENGCGFTFTPPEHPAHLAPQAKMGRPVPPGSYGQFIGNFSGVPLARTVMDMPWANRDGLREAIPPAYTCHIGQAIARTLTTTIR